MPGYVPPSLLPRMAMAERPDGFVPVLSAPSEEHRISSGHSHAPSTAYTRLELERIMKRFGNDIEAEPLRYAPQEPIAPKESFKDFKCERCHTLSNYGQGMILDKVPAEPKLEIKLDDWHSLEAAISSKTLLVKIVDLIDVPYSLHTSIYDLLPHKHELPTILVGNKIDLLPGHGRSTVDHATNCLGKLAKDMNVLGIHLISAKTGFGVDSLHRAILRYAAQEKQSVLLAGRTNVGKSLVYNSFCSRQVEKHQMKSTVSAAHGTTIGVLKKKLSNITSPWKVPKNLFLFDIPGLYLPERHLGNSYFTLDELESASIQTKISPIKHSLNKFKVGLIAGFCRIETDAEDDLPFQLFMQSSLPYHKRSIATADEFFSEFQGIAKDVPPNLMPPVFSLGDTRKHQHPMDLAVEFSIEPTDDENQIAVDAVFGGGLGWIAFGRPLSKSVTIRLYTPSGLGIRLRDPPIRPNFL